MSGASAALVVGTQALKTDVIFREGERADSMYVIEQGAVELSRHAVVLTHLDQGAAFGEDSLVGRQHIGRAGDEEGERVEEHQIKRVRSATRHAAVVFAISWSASLVSADPIRPRSFPPCQTPLVFSTLPACFQGIWLKKGAAVRSGRRRRCRSATSS